MIYLHHEKSIVSNIFCEKLLRDPAVVRQLDARCVLWPWDVTDEANRSNLLASLAKPCEHLNVPTSSFAMPRSLSNSLPIAARIRALLSSNPPPDQFPVLYIVFKMELSADPQASNSHLKMRSIAVYETTGNSTTADELVALLDEAYKNTTNADSNSGAQFHMRVQCNLPISYLYYSNTSLVYCKFL